MIHCEIKNVRGHYEIFYNGEFIGSEDTHHEADIIAREYEDEIREKREIELNDLKESYNRSSDFI